MFSYKAEAIFQLNLFNEGLESMSNKKSMGIVAVTLVSVMVFGVNFADAGEEAYKQSERGLASGQPAKEAPICPSCKEMRLSPEKGRVLAAIPMVCPDCKNEISGLTVHYCDKCGKDVLVCELCQKASAGLKALTMISKCPRCKRVRSRFIREKALAKWKIKCLICRHKLQEWFIQHCDICDVDFLACLNCKKEQEKFQK